MLEKFIEFSNMIKMVKITIQFTAMSLSCVASFYAKWWFWFLPDEYTNLSVVCSSTVLVHRHNCEVSQWLITDRCQMTVVNATVCVVPWRVRSLRVISLVEAHPVQTADQRPILCEWIETKCGSDRFSSEAAVRPPDIFRIQQGDCPRLSWKCGDEELPLSLLISFSRWVQHCTSFIWKEDGKNWRIKFFVWALFITDKKKKIR